MLFRFHCDTNRILNFKITDSFDFSVCWLIFLFNVLFFICCFFLKQSLLWSIVLMTAWIVMLMYFSRWSREKHHLGALQGKNSCTSTIVSSMYWTVQVRTLFLCCFKYNYNTGISYESLGPDEVRSLLTTVRNLVDFTSAFWTYP